jgi:HAD superfamily hydrolase (TIGR01450 family)
LTRVAVVGLGAMGSRIAARLLAAGHEVIGWARSPDRRRALAAIGVLPTTTPADAARRAEILITMVADPAALRAVTEGTDGVAAGAGTNLTVVEMSTVGPAAVARLASVLPAGVGLVDAPVLGSIAEAEAGSLTILAGGPAPRIERVTPLLSALGAVIAVGDLGAGAAAKVVANAVLFGTVAMLGEALALARGLGLSTAATYDVLSATPLAAQAARRREAIETRSYPPRFRLGLARKDATLIQEAAAGARVALRLAPAAGAWLAEAEAAGLGDHDYTAMLATILGAVLAPTAPSPIASTPGQPVRPHDGLVVDLDGVVWLAGEPIEGAAEAIAALRASGTRLLFLTNEPARSRAQVAARLAEIGIEARPADVLTSATAAARVAGGLKGLPNRRALVVGPPALQDEIREVGFELAPAGAGRDAAVVVVGGHDRFDYDELRGATLAVRNGARLFATGRDAVFPTPDGLWPGTGAVLAAIETASGAQATVVGKPEPVIFEMAREALAGCMRIAVIGDNLVADIAGAKRAGLGAILVLTGTCGPADLARAAIRPDLVFDSLAAYAHAAAG